MKLLSILFALTTLASLPAFADSFQIIRDGISYTCRADTITPVDPGGSLACVDRAYSGPFNRDESMEICAGARTTAPADCAIQAYTGPFNKAESIALCKGARSQGPSECAITLYAGPFSKDEALNFCGINSTKAHADCAIKAYQGPYSREESLRLCKADPQLLLKALKIIEKSRDAQIEVLKIKSKQQSVID